jgi:hypothetical protein
MVYRGATHMQLQLYSCVLMHASGNHGYKMTPTPPPALFRSFFPLQISSVVQFSSVQFRTVQSCFSRGIDAVRAAALPVIIVQEKCFCVGNGGCDE